ncbi:MAG: Lrp/AsnC ligand binding domain-containing protein [Spirochaetales bacterium]|nr:Lrp/AsnC ligand binding domain-containing protein [Spirochaetales bacterium]
MAERSARRSRRPGAGASSAGSGSVKCFRDVQEREQAYEKRDRGLTSVPVERIVGSVNRYRDFDSRFRLKGDRPQERYRRVLDAMQRGRPLAPVELYQIKNEYFVVDGNHRIAAAKERGFTEVPARVVEFLPRRGSRENVLYRERAEFQERTGLPEAIDLTELGQYEVLLRQIAAHRRFLQQATGEQVPLSSAAEDWHRSVYRPLVSIIAKEGLEGKFPGRTSADLYAYVSSHQWEKNRRRGFGLRVNRAITESMEEFRKTMSERQEQDYPEMLRELTAFVLLNIAAKKERAIVDRLFALEEVRELHSVHGTIDVLLKVVLVRDLLCSDAEVISDFVQQKIRAIPGILSSQTLIPGLSKTKEGGSSGGRADRPRGC